jgi:hypothetical protein
MLPAYPAFAILAALGLKRYVPARCLRVGLRVAMPIIAAGFLIAAALPHTHLEAAEIRPVAQAATAATAPGERVAFYDQGQPRFDEDNQMAWYGDRYLYRLFQPGDLSKELSKSRARVYVIDNESYRTYVAGRIPHDVLTQSGHLICIRLCPGEPLPCHVKQP